MIFRLSVLQHDAKTGVALFSVTGDDIDNILCRKEVSPLIRQPIHTTESEVLAFRMEQQHLAVKVPAEQLVAVCGACGIPNTLDNQASMVLALRVAQYSQERLVRAMTQEKTLVQMWSLRGAPWIFPVADINVFTRAILPTNETWIRHFMTGCEPALMAADMNADRLFNLVLHALDSVLQGRALTQDELEKALSLELEDHFSSAEQEVWRWPSDYGQGVLLGESLVRHILKVVALTGVVCYAQWQKALPTYMLTADFLGKPIPLATEADDHQAQMELLRRYLHCYGPATEEGFSQWAGICREQAANMWATIQGWLVRVECQHRDSWILEEDAGKFTQRRMLPEGVRLLPPNDPFLQLAERNYLVQGKQLYRYFWKSVDNPGMLLFDGQCVAGWHMRTEGDKAYFTIDDVGLAIGRVTQSELDTAAAQLAQCLDLRYEGYTVHEL